MYAERRAQFEIVGSETGEPRSDYNAANLDRQALKSDLLDQIALVHEMSPDGRITRMNSLFCARAGVDAAEIASLGHHALNVDLGEGRSWLALHQETTPGQVWMGETRNHLRDGTYLCLSSTITAMRDANGALTGYLAASLDVTERSRLREEFDRSGKLMQLGKLTATVAHEIRNPLGAIRTANYVLACKIKDKVEGVDAQLERINSGISRCDKIITELLDFSRNRAKKPAAFAVDDWVKAVVEEESRNLYGAPAVTCEGGLGREQASFDPDQMRQVLINLLSNAAEAIAEKTQSGAEDGFAPHISVRTRADGAYARIIVEDNGPGIDPSNLPRIREPLFTTKSFGVGLGIPAVEKILETHGGGLEIEGRFGSGARITASFLRSAAAAA